MYLYILQKPAWRIVQKGYAPKKLVRHCSRQDQTIPNMVYLNFRNNISAKKNCLFIRKIEIGLTISGCGLLYVVDPKSDCVAVSGIGQYCHGIQDKSIECPQVPHSL